VVLIDGVERGTSVLPSGTTYTISLAAVPEGEHVLEVQAIDLAGNVTKQQRNITVAFGALGESCAANVDCKGNLCAATADGDSFCTQTCGDGMGCPDDFSCTTAGTQQVCVPSDDGGCSATGGTGGPGAGGLLGLLAVALISMRRRHGAAR
jgi:uncharacterized protein (TIGR03382 family)